MKDAGNCTGWEKAYLGKSHQIRHSDRDWYSDRISFVQHELLHHGPHVDT